MHSEKVLGAIEKDRCDGTFCDLDIVCGQSRFHVHRVVVCPHSPVIQAACLGPWKEGASGVFEIKESSDTLVSRMLDYIYTGNYEELTSEVPAEDVQSSSSELAKPGPDPKVMLHAKMMEMGDIYLVDGLGLLANDRFNNRLKSQTTRDVLVEIVPEVYAMEFKSCKLIRTTLIDFMRRRLMQRPLPAEVEESWEDATKNVPEFTRDLLKSFKDMPVLGHCHYCGITKTVPVAPLQLTCLLCRNGGALNLRMG